MALNTVTREIAPEPQQRRFGRHRVMLAAKLHSPHGVSTAVLLDLSQGGAMIALPLPLPQGSHVVLMRGQLEAHAVIAWAEGRRVGLMFDSELSEQQVDEIVSPERQSAH